MIRELFILDLPKSCLLGGADLCPRFRSGENDDATKRKVNLVFEKIQTLKSRAAGSSQVERHLGCRGASLALDQLCGIPAGGGEEEEENWPPPCPFGHLNGGTGLGSLFKSPSLLVELRGVVCADGVPMCPGCHRCHPSPTAPSRCQPPLSPRPCWPCPGRATSLVRGPSPDCAKAGSCPESTRVPSCYPACPD